MKGFLGDFLIGTSDRPAIWGCSRKSTWLRKIAGVVLCLCSFFPSVGNNVQLIGEVKIIPREIKDNIVPVKLKISWENSWKDDYNQDGVYLFLKYRVNGADEEWHTVPLLERLDFISGPIADQYGYMFQNTLGDKLRNVGVILYRQREGSGKSELDLQLYWDITLGERPLTTTEIEQGKVSLSAMAIEMVYIPKGAFYLGDSYSNHSFGQKYTGIPEKYDIVNDGYLIDTKNNVVLENNPPAYAANRVNDVREGVTNCWVGDGSRDQFWRIDFGSYRGQPTGKRRKIKYIAIESIPGHVPARWQLYGSNRLAGESVLLYEGTGADWNTSLIRTYPVTQKIALTDTSATFRYYEIRITDMGNAKGPAIKNVSMAEADLDKLVDGNLLIAAPGGCFTTEGAMKVDHLYAADGDMEEGCLPVGYPNGYTDFYVMKYEMSQEQYVAFLNHLTLKQQAARTIGAALLDLKRGQFVFGDNHSSPSCRNGIVVSIPSVSGQAVVFGHNLNEDTIYSSVGDGQTLACNYLSPADMLAYAEWCGLRPLTEMEYEKMCHRPFPALPDRGEFAWNTTEYQLPSGQIDGISGDHSETPKDGNVNAGQRFFGPLRSGAFARETSGQISSGATFWAVMEVSGNLTEICYNANQEGRKFSGLSADMHGWGKLTSRGECLHLAYWPAHPDAFALKGGSYNTLDPGQLASSDRTFSKGNFKSMEQRKKDVTFRLGCSGQAPYWEIPVVMGNGSVTTGEQLVFDTICSGGDEVLKAVIPESLGKKYTIAWFVSENQGKSWELMEGETAPDLWLSGLKYEDVDDMSTKEYWYRMQVWDAKGDGGSGIAVVRVLNSRNMEYHFNRLADTLRVFDDAYGIELTVANCEASFEWWCTDNNRRIRLEPEKANRSFFRVNKSDLRNFDEEPAGDYQVYVLMKYSQRCMVREELDIYAQTPEDLKDRVRIIQHSKGYRLWEDGSYAADVSVYRHPVSPYVYAGDVGNGLYRIDHVDTSRRDLYCNMENYAGTDIPIVRLGGPGGVHLWGDGSCASSMKEYKMPEPGYAYTGSTESGIFRLTPSKVMTWGRVVDVYCDLENYLGVSEPVVRLRNQEGERLWGDLTMAASIKEYKHPRPGYAYTGCIGDGIYKVAPKDTSWVPAVCDFYSCMTAYTGNLEPVVQLGGPEGARLWGDGTVASTVLDYKNAPAGYEYSGCIGTGLYQITRFRCFTQLLNVYCDWKAYETESGQPFVFKDGPAGIRLLGDGSLPDPFAGCKEQTFTDVNVNSYQVECKWEEQIPKIWSVAGMAAGGTINDKGVITGRSVDCEDVFVTLKDKECPDKSYQAKIIMAPQAPFGTGTVQQFTYSGNTVALNAGTWGAAVAKIWSFEGEHGDLTISNNTLSGLNTTICNVKVSVALARCPEIKFEKTIKETTRNFSYTGNAVGIKVLPGTYSIECKGAGGGTGYRNWGTASVYDCAHGGYGGYATGIITLPAQRTFYVYVGGAGGSDAWAGGAGGWNGGGHGGTDGNSSSSGTSGDDSGGGGGGASDIRLDGSLQSRIIVAGGGGGGSDWYSLGGKGGGLTGGYGLKGKTQVSATTPGGQSSGYSFGNGGSGGSSNDSGSYTVAGGGGGGGWYGGYGGYAGNAGSASGGGGGSSYVAGVAGCSRSNYLNFTSGSVTGTGSSNSSNGSIKIIVK